MNLPGLTPFRRELLARLGIADLNSLLRHFPRAYDDLRDLRRIATLRAGDAVTVQGEVVELDSQDLRNGGSLLRVVVSDDGLSVLEGVWFNQPRMASRFRYGLRVSLSGKPKYYRDRWQMTAPRVGVLDGDAPDTPGILGVYRLTEDFRADHLRHLLREALERPDETLIDLIPPSLRAKHRWPDLLAAFRHVHFPETPEEADHARKRFDYEELLVVQTALALRRRMSADGPPSPSLPVSPAVDERIRRLFPFPFTGDQNRAVGDIVADIARTSPMQRLVQADVGAGKTAVAVYAMLAAVANKHQAALLAPTEVLARQHMRTLDRMLAHSRVRRLLLTGGMSARERVEARRSLASGDVDLVVGTQALLQEGVAFARLGVVVIDEQHKFGVDQRATVKAMAASPHYLVMTATPIPRTMALTVFGDLDVSVIRELPPGRQTVKTKWLREGERSSLVVKLRDALREGRQAYVVCPMVEESASGLRSAVAVHREYAKTFPEVGVGLLHGRLCDDEKERAMTDFAEGRTAILVATTVIEVGIDVPNATWMIVEDAERFGLSQLHQLRGRVSRGSHPGFCYVFADPAGDEGRERLRAFVRTTDGFELAEEDAKQRGAGELFGTRQSGAGELWRLAQASGDLLGVAREDAFALVEDDGTLAKAENAELRSAVVGRYGDVLPRADVG